MSKTLQRILSFAMAVLMVLSYVPTSAFATGDMSGDYSEDTEIITGDVSEEPVEEETKPETKPEPETEPETESEPVEEVDYEAVAALEDMISELPDPNDLAGYDQAALEALAKTFQDIENAYGALNGLSKAEAADAWNNYNVVKGAWETAWAAIQEDPIDDLSGEDNDETPVADVEYAAEVNGVYYDDLQAAIDAAGYGDTVKLLSDLELYDEGIKVSADDDIMLDLNGHLITGYHTVAQAFALIENEGQLRIINTTRREGEPVSIALNSTAEASTAYAVNTILNRGTLIVEAGLIANYWGDNSVQSNQIGYAIDNNSTEGDAILTLTGGAAVQAYGSSYYDGIRQFCNSTTHTNHVTVSGYAWFTSLWVQNPSDGTAGHNTKQVNGSFTIAANEGPVSNVVYVEPNLVGESAITSGIISQVAYYDTESGTCMTGFISGGKFMNAPDAAMIAEGYEAVESNGQYIIQQKSAEPDPSDTPVVEVPEDAPVIDTETNESVSAEVVTQIKDSIANNEAITKITSATTSSLPAGAELQIQFLQAKVTDGALVELNFEVTPVKDGTEVEPTAAVTFRLPVPPMVNLPYAVVYHDGALMGTYDIEGTSSNRYVEVSSANFSEFKVVPTSEAPATGATEVATYDELVAALANGGEIVLTDDITLDTSITVPDGTVIDLNTNTLYVNVEESSYDNVTIKNGSIVLGKDDVQVCDGYFLVNEGKTLVLNGVNVSSSSEGIKGYAVFHLKTGANLDLINSSLNIRDNEYSAGYIVYANEPTATVDVVNTTITGSKVNGIVHATTVIDNSTVTLTNVIEHGINRSGVTIDDSNVTISGGTGRGITAQHGDLVITGTSVVNITNMGEATIELRNNKNLTIADTAKVTVDVPVNNTTSGTITGAVTVKPAGPVEIDLSQSSYTITEAGEYTVKGVETQNTLSVDAEGNVTITLNGVTINAPDGDSAISIEKGNVTLFSAGAANTLNGGDNGAGIYVAANASLTIKGDEMLTATGNNGTDDTSGAAGIGGAYGKGASGEITIDGASVTAKGYGVWASGIGSAGGYAADITIKGGANVVAVGGYYANGVGTLLQTKYGKSDPEGGAAIGGGSKSGAGVGTITITDSTVKAYGGSKAAGIGAMFWNSVEAIAISGTSDVTAQGGSSSAAIGTSRAGDSGVSANITISGGKVTATGGAYGSGIGAGYNADSLGNGANASALPETKITISGGTVIATGGEGGAAIGGGYKSDNVNIDITGGTVTATAGKLVEGKTVENGGAPAAIGSGANGSGKFENSPAAEVASSASVTVNAYEDGKPAIEGMTNEQTAAMNNVTLNETPNPNKVYVAQIGNDYYATLAEALTAAADGATIELIWAEGDAPISMAGSVVGNKTVTITGTAQVDWTKGNLMIGRGGEGNGKVIFDNATITSAVKKNPASTGIHVSGSKGTDAATNNGTLVIKNSNIELDYLINRNETIIESSSLTVYGGCWTHGRDASESDTGEDATASMTIDAASTVTVVYENGMGVGGEGKGVMTVRGTYSANVLNVSAKGTVKVDGGKLDITGQTTNNGIIEITGESTLNLPTLSGNSIDLNEGAIVKDSTVGGAAYVAGNVTFRGDNTFTMITDYGDFYSSVTPSKWTVEKGASLTLTKSDRYGLGYGDQVTIYGEIEDALTARATLTDDDLSVHMYGGLVGMTNSAAPNAQNKLLIQDAYASFGVEGDKSFGNKAGNYYGNYEIVIDNSVITANAFKFYEDLGSSVVNITGTDMLVNGVFMTNDASSKFTFTDSVIVSNAMSNGTDDKNQNAGELTLVKTSLTYSAPFTNAGTLTLGEGSSLTAPSISGEGKIVIDATGMAAGEVATIKGDASGFTGTIEVINSDGLQASVVDGKIVLSAKPVAQIGETKYATLEEAIAKAEDGDTVKLIADVSDVDLTISNAITLDLGEKTITDAYIIVTDEVTVKNGTIKNTNEPYPLVVQNGGKLTVEDVDIEASKSDRAIWVRSGSSLVFNSGSILATKGENNTKTSLIAAIYTDTNTDVTINGGTITVDTPNNKAIGIFGNYTNADVTVNGGKISTSGKNYSYGINVDGDITVTGGEIVTNEKGYGYSSGIRYGNNYALVTATGDVTISGGTITTNGYSGYIVNVGRTYSSNDQTVTINGGILTNNLSEVEQTAGGHKAPVLIWEGSASNVTATVTNGAFNGFSADLLRGDNTDLAVSGGTFDVEINKEYCAEGFKVVANSNGTYGVVADPAYGKVAMIGEIYYATFAEAAANIATDGSDTTIKLLTDIELTESIAFNYGTGKIIFTADEPVTVKQTKNGLDLDFILGNAANIIVEKNVTFEISDNAAGMYVYYGPNLTVNGTITGGANWGCLYLYNGEHAVNGTVNVGRVQSGFNTITVKGTMDTNYLLVEGGTFIADGATVDANVIFDNNNGGQRWGASQFSIQGGSKVTTTKLTLSYADSTLTIDGTSTLTANSIVGAGKIIIDAQGLTAGASPITGDASGFTGTIEVINNDDLYAKIDENGNIVLAAKLYVAQIGETKYETLAGALAAVQEGQTIQLLPGTFEVGSVKFPATLKNVTIKGAENKTTVLKDSLLYSADGNAVNYQGITIDGIVFDNSQIVFTGARGGEVVYKDWTITNCEFKNVESTSNSAIHFNLASDETLENLTFTNNVINGVSGGSVSGLRANYLSGNVTITGNEISGVAWNAIQLINGNTTTLTIENNTVASGASEGILNLYNVTATNLSIKGNKFLVADGQPGICYLASGDVSGNYWGGKAPANLPEGLTCKNYYSDADLTTLVKLGLDGEGTEASPYLINNLEDLKWFRDHVNTFAQDGSSQYTGMYIKLTADINLDEDGDGIGEEWEPIGSTTADHGSFYGIFDGDDHTIYNLVVSEHGTGSGFFAKTSGGGDGPQAVIRNITFHNVDVDAGNNASYAGGVIANAGGNSVVSNVHVTGKVYVNGYGYVGGIVGHGYPDIDNCSVNAEEGSYVHANYWCAGGIIGYAGEGGTVITNSSVSGVDIWSAYGGAAAVAGLLLDGNKLDKVSASDVKVTSNSDYFMGYIAGNGESSTMTNVTAQNVTATANGEEITSTDAVAEVNGTIYFDLAEAMKAAKSGETVLLLRDVDLAGTEWEPVSFAGKFDGQDHIISNLTINKPGVSNTGFITSLNSTFENVTFTNPTVTGGECTGVVAGRAGGGAALAQNITVNGTIKVETTHSGYARAGVIVGGWAYGNYVNITVDGGDAATSYIKHTGGGDGRYVAGIVGHADDVESYVNCTVKNITISGGWLCGGIAGPGPADGLASGCTVENINMGADYSGGMFGWYSGNGTIENGSIDNVTFTDGTTANGAIGGYGYNESATVTNVTIGNINNGGKALVDHAAEVNGTYYFDLAEAVAVGGEVKLLRNVTLTEALNIANGASVTLDLNKKTLTGSILAPNADLTVKNGSIKNPNSGASAIEINAGKLTLTDVNIESARHAVRIDGAVEATINGGTYTVNAPSGTRHAVNISGAANLTIKSGTFVGPAGTTMDSGSAVCVQAGATATIEGGDFSKGKNSTLGVSGTMTITGGTFDQDPSAYVAKGYKAVTNADGKYEVVEKIDVAKIGEIGYETFEEALAAACDDASVTEIVILCDSAVTTVENTTDYYDITQNLKITAPEGESYTVSINPVGDSIAVRVKDGGSLTIAENVSIDHLDIVANGFATTGENMTIDGNLKAKSLKQWTSNGTITVSETGSVWLGFGDGQFDMAYGNGAVTVNGNGDKTNAQFKAGYSGTRGNGNTLNLNDTYFEAGAWFNVNGSNGTFNVDNSILKVSGGDSAGKLTITSTGNTINLTNGSELAVANLTIGKDNTVKLGSGSKITTTTITGAGAIEIDVTGMTAGEVATVTGDLSGFTGTVTATGNDNLYAKVENGKIVLVERNYVAQIGETKYESLAEAIEAAKDGDTVTLLADVIPAETLVIDKPITLDLGGYTITGTGTVYRPVKVAGNNADITVTITNGTIQTKDVTYTPDQAAALLVYDGADVTLEDVTLNGTNYGVMLAGNYSYSTGVAKNNTTSLIVNAGTKITAENAAIIEQGAYPNTYIEINEGAEVTSTDSIAIYLPTKGERVINGGTITGATGIVLRAGSLTVNGGTIAANGAAAANEFVDSGAISTGDGIVVLSNDYGYYGAPTASINGGKVTSVNGKAVVSYAADGFEVVTDIIADGTFSSDVSDLCVDGFKAEQNAEGLYEIVELPVIATVNGVEYTDLNKALADAVTAGGDVTVEILDDIDLTGTTWTPVDFNSYIGANANTIVINGNEKTITGLSDMMFSRIWTGTKLEVNDLTIDKANIVNDAADTQTKGVGAIIGNVSAIQTVELNNVSLTDSHVEGGHWTGGLIGYAAGYSGNDGPVFTTITVNGGTISGNTITGKGSVGGVIGHATGDAWTEMNVSGAAITGNTITSTGSSTNKAGSVMGTIGAAGTSQTTNGTTLTGGVNVAATVSGNNVTSNGTAITTIYGRQGSSTGALTVTGGSYDTYPIEQNVSYAAPEEGYVIEQNTNGMYELEEAPEVVDEVAQNVQTGVTYASVNEALAEAQSGETIILLKDTTDGNVLVTPGITLDLNGFALTASNLVAFPTAHVVDNVNTGKLVAGENNVVLQGANAMMPVYDGTGYLFTNFLFKFEKDSKYNGEGVKINTLITTRNMDIINLFKNGSADNNIRMMILLTWDAGEAVRSQSFEFKDGTIAEVFASNINWSTYGKMFTMVVTGLESVENLTAQVQIVSGTHAEVISTTTTKLN